MKFKCKKCNFKSNKQLNECPECGGEIKKGGGCIFKGLMIFLVIYAIMVVVGIVDKNQEKSEFNDNIEKKYSELKSSLEDAGAYKIVFTPSPFKV